jgi:hypothetical protein
MTEREVAHVLCTQGRVTRPGRPDEVLAVRPHPLLDDELLIFLFDAATGAEVQRFRCEISEVDMTEPTATEPTP